MNAEEARIRAARILRDKAQYHYKKAKERIIKAANNGEYKAWLEDYPSIEVTKLLEDEGFKVNICSNPSEFVAYVSW